MTVDGFTLYAIVRELDAALKYARIDKIFMPSKDDIDIILRVGNANKRLKISVNPVNFRMHITQHAGKNPDTPPVFCMFMRKHLTGAQIKSILMNGLERVVFIKLAARDEMGVKKPLTLIAELMGKNSNCVITDENGRIMECLKHIGLDVSRVRQMLPSLPYTPPPGDKLNPFSLSEKEIAGILLGRGQKSIANHLCASLQGFSPPAAQELAARFSGTAGDSGLAKGIRESMDALSSGSFCPRIAQDPATGKAYFSVLPAPGREKQFETVNDMLDAYFYGRQQEERLASRREALQKSVQKHIEKREKRLQSQLETLKEASGAEDMRKYGDLITANLYRIHKGADFALVEDYYADGGRIRIPLDRRLTPSANAQKYYKRYSKLKSAAEITKTQMEENKAELDFLKSVELSLLNCENIQELEEIQFELIKTGYLTEKKGQKPRPQEAASTPHAFLSSDGFEIFAGKNNRQNELLTLKYAGANDIWLHVKDFPGAHVIIKNGGREVPGRTIEEAAAVAAVLSRGKQADKVAIDYTQRKNVKKPSGAKPGMVIYENYRTVYIKPDTEVFNRIKNRAIDKTDI